MVSIHSALYRKKDGGKLSRFAGTSHHADKASAELDPNHPAVKAGTTIFPKSIFTPAKSPRLLIPGHNNPKVGAMVMKGPWEGAAIFTLSLVERETCPRDCETWRSCYGNAMPLARRHRPDHNLKTRLEKEVEALTGEHGKIAVRLHVLGDFYSVPYVMFWAALVTRHPGLHIWGYTSRKPDTPIGREIALTNQWFPDRFNIRFSNTPDPYRSTGIIWRQPEGSVVPEGQVCPASMEKTAACGTCGICWAPEMLFTRIVFIGHGMNTQRKKDTSVSLAAPPAPR
jgi:hypothetical protein